MSVKDEDSFSRAGDVVKAIFDRISPGEMQLYTELRGAWRDIAGEDAAFHVVPRDIRDGTLVLEADHPGWSQKVRMMQGAILRKIQSRYPELEVRRIHLRIGNTQGT